MTTGMESNRLARPTKIGKVFVDKERSVVPIKGTFPTYKVLDIELQHGSMIPSYQLIKDGQGIT